MSRRVAFRQSDVVRAIKAAKVAGAGRVVVRRDGALEIEIEQRRPRDDGDAGHEPFDEHGQDREIVL